MDRLENNKIPNVTSLGLQIKKSYFKESKLEPNWLLQFRWQAVDIPGPVMLTEVMTGTAVVGSTDWAQLWCSNTLVLKEGYAFKCYAATLIHKICCLLVRWRHIVRLWFSSKPHQQSPLNRNVEALLTTNVSLKKIRFLC